MFGAKFRVLVLPVVALFGLLVFLTFVHLGCKKHEHPSEHPVEGEVKAGLTKDELADAIEAHVNEIAVAQGGYFTVVDDKTGEKLELLIDKVHRERLSKVGEDLYFACADFVTPRGKVYDLDVFMKGKSKDDLVFHEFMIHKEAGKERYTWYEHGGIWKRESVNSEVEHPKEHPKEHPEEPPVEHPQKSSIEHPQGIE